VPSVHRLLINEACLDHLFEDLDAPAPETQNLELADDLLGLRVLDDLDHRRVRRLNGKWSRLAQIAKNQKR